VPINNFTSDWQDGIKVWGHHARLKVNPLHRWVLWWTVLPLAFALTGTTGTLRRTSGRRLSAVQIGGTKYFTSVERSDLPPQEVN
jgi:hypothetical protein